MSGLPNFLCRVKVSWYSSEKPDGLHESLICFALYFGLTKSNPSNLYPLTSQEINDRSSKGCLAKKVFWPIGDNLNFDKNKNEVARGRDL